MPRLLTLTLALLAATPALASAQCLVSSVGRGEISGISVDDPLVEIFGYESVDVALELQLGLRQLPSRGDVRGADEEGGTLWCLSPNDPRCFPVDGPTEAPAPVDPMPSSSAPITPLVSAHSAATEPASSAVEAGPAGVATRVERPPRN